MVADAHSCSCCSVKFTNAVAQRAHFKLDWHRYNIKRQLAGLSPVREEAFSIIADEGGLFIVLSLRVTESKKFYSLIVRLPHSYLSYQMILRAYQDLSLNQKKMKDKRKIM